MPRPPRTAEPSSDREYVAALKVLRRMVADVEANGVSGEPS
ncbi:hypothetical protein AAH978_10270 [Streptomyces sp. ZYX-F-203]